MSRVEAETPRVRLSDYAPPDFLVDRVALRFRLDPGATRVTARIAFRPNPDRRGAPAPRDLLLDGRNLVLHAARIDGAAVPPEALRQGPEGLRVAAAWLPEGDFVWEAETEIAPEANTALEGLYISRGMYCTQCEAQGFRKITFYPDRPDVMAPFRVRIEGDAPVLLSNGNLLGSGPGWAEWEDPFPKPSYLFALVAGDLRAVEDRFTTRSGRDVLLQIWVRPGDEPRCGYAMDALKRAMAWDETEYGREYDLDRFMIVVVDDFNAGAMENKGLNVFNSRYVLASPDTATDSDYKSIEAIVAHEYFHNWTGNRITCRDWFQLCLKEGLTVFRDQQFSSDQRGAGVKRIEDVIRLRATQFREDASPLAHPVRPEEYIEINNFYTATVYEKGAEVIGMLRRIVGPETYARALDLYFDRHDGQACTIEDWLRVFEDASGRDLTQFARWYSQAGTPHVTARGTWEGGLFTLALAQSTAPTAGQPRKAPLLIPVACALFDPETGAPLTETVLELSRERQDFTWDLPARPVVSLLRGFSAPVILSGPAGGNGGAFLLAHETDPFSKWQAGRSLALGILAKTSADPGAAPDPDYLAALARVAEDPALAPDYRALLLDLPSLEEAIAHLVESGRIPDPLALHHARRRLEAAIADSLGPRLRHLYDAHGLDGPYSPDAAAAGHRALRGCALALITAQDAEAALAATHFAAADNMTERMAALSLLVGRNRAEAALAAFRAAWRDDRLVLDKWFAVQAAHSPPETAVATVEALTRDPDFDWQNPNRFRALIGTFANANLAAFHAADGAGYRLLADWLIRLDPVNPQTTARMTSAFATWRSFDAGRQALIRGELRRLGARPGLSRDTGEMVERLLREADG